MMGAMQPTSTFQVVPLHQQVEIRDAAGAEVPQWGSEAEAAIASDQCLLLATRSDLDGPVEVDVWVGVGGPEAPAGQLVFDGELNITGDEVLIGNSLGGQLHRIPLPIGWHSVRVYADPPDAAARLSVVFDGAGAAVPG
jgi:hypothetical protein